MALKLSTRLVEKPWGRSELPAMFAAASGERIGEVWFTAAEELPLLAKYIFTSERLSIQVHPNDEQARRRGLRQGKSECWYIIDAEPGATLGLGLTRSASAEELRAAALDGSIEQLIAWRPVRAGDFFMVPSGTVHAIGAGISLLEFQQNSDVTYRLYDYGRPRELHLDDGIAVAVPEPFAERLVSHPEPRAEQVLVAGPHFSLVQLGADGSGGEQLEQRRRWVMPIDGEAATGGLAAGPGECLLLEPAEPLRTRDGRVLVGAEGALQAG
jgi:mannose-6-phosphate isomerase